MKKKEKESYLDKIKSGKIAKFLPSIQAKILLRDKFCIICNSKWKTSGISDYHHVYYWAIQAEKNNPDRNNPDKWVWLCSKCHNEIHHWKNWLSQEFRDFCIDYIKKIKKCDRCWKINPAYIHTCTPWYYNK